MGPVSNGRARRGYPLAVHYVEDEEALWRRGVKAACGRDPQNASTSIGKVDCGACLTSAAGRRALQVGHYSVDRYGHVVPEREEAS